MDTLVLDIETKNTFADVASEGTTIRAEALQLLEVSVVCVYSYQKNKYFCFDESQFAELKQLLNSPTVLVGFSSNKFDIPILQRVLSIDLFSYPRIDLSDEVEVKTGRMISLDKLTKLNLGVGKIGLGLGAKDLYNEGKIDELKAYCQNDVKITKELFDFVKKNKHLLVPDGEDENPKKINITLPIEAAGW